MSRIPLVKMELKQRIESFAIRVYNEEILQLHYFLEFTLSIHLFHSYEIQKHNPQVMNSLVSTILNNKKIMFITSH